MGGVERQFITLANLLSRSRRVLLVTLMKADHLAGCNLAENVEHKVLYDKIDRGKTPVWMLPGARNRLASICRNEKVDVLYSARELANLIAAWAIGRHPDIRLLWGHRVSQHRFTMRIRLLFPLCRLLQGRVHCQVANSADGISFYRKMGLCRGKTAQIPNFLDGRLFQPSAKQRTAQRKAWGLANNEQAVGIVGRVAPMKNHEGFLRMASRLASEFPRARFLVIGTASGPAGESLLEKIARNGLQNRVSIHPAQQMDRMASVYNALDILCSTSLYGEGFGNVIAEAMSCACPVVATDVGEARTMLGNLSPVIRPGDDEAFAQAVANLLKIGPQPLGNQLRNRILAICEPEAILNRLTELAENS